MLLLTGRLLGQATPATEERDLEVAYHREVRAGSTNNGGSQTNCRETDTFVNTIKTPS